MKELHIYPEAKKCTPDEGYTRTTQYQLREEGKESITGATGPGYMGEYKKPYFSNYNLFLKSLGLSKDDVEITRHSCWYDSGNIH